MPVASNTVNKARELLERRHRELTQELRQIESAIRGLGGGRRGPGRPRGSTTTTRRRGRRGGSRADQAVRIIKQNPGIGVADLAKRMRLKAPNYLYRVLPGLEKEGRVKKRGRGYHPG